MKAWRRFLLLAMAIVSPSALLCVIGLYIAAQERELDSKRLVEQRAAMLASMRDRIEVRLESIRSRAAANWREFQSPPYQAMADPEVALVALVENGHGVPPWEGTTPRSTLRHTLLTGPFATAVAKAERGESTFASAAEHAVTRAQEAYLHLTLAASLRKSGDAARAQREYELLFREMPAVTDEHGIPFALYAAIALRRVPEYAGCSTPECARLFRNTLVGLGQPPPPALLELHHWIDRVEALFSELTVLPNPDQWAPVGDPPWLASTVVQKGSPLLLVAVRAERLLEAGVRLSRTQGEPLGERFRGLRMVLAPQSTGSTGPTRLPFIQASLTLVIAVSLFSAWLLWRDLHREEQLARTRAHFVASVSHELRTPLTAIRMFAETLRLRPNAGMSRRETCLDTIIAESERLSRLVDNVLDFSRIEQGRKIYQLTNVELKDVLKGAILPLRFPLEQGGFDLRMQIPSEPVPVHADADAIQQAAMNLLTNAMKYSGDSRIIGLNLYRDGQEAVLEVRDQGIGIHETDQQLIFESFYRVESQVSRAVPGAGLGLTLVAHIARAHHGRVTVSSSPGAGSTFALRLPLHEAL